MQGPHDGGQTDGVGYPYGPAPEGAAAASAGVGAAAPTGEAGGEGGAPPLPPRRSGRSALWKTAGVALAGAVVGGAAVTVAAPAYRAWAQGLPSITTVPVSSDQQAAGAPAVAVYQKLGPSVVMVRNEQSVNTYFGQQNQTAWGSGVIFSSDGYIVTNYHVVQGATKVTVTLADGSTFPATVVGGDPSTDLAVIKISPDKPLPAATFANSDDVSPGEIAIAIGNPLGPQYAQSVDQGIVSANRPMLYGFDSTQMRVTKMIQTDAPINPGNSGGPLANAQGEVIGIVSMKTAQTGEPGVAAAGLGFAIPSNVVQQITQQLIQYGYVKWPYLGIGFSGNLSNGLPSQPQTLTIANVVSGGPSDGKLQPGDVITSWNGQRVINYYDLVGDVTAAQPGQTVALGILRGGRAMTVQITLGTEPKSAALDQGQPQQQPATPSNPGAQPYPFPFPFPFPGFGNG